MLLSTHESFPQTQPYKNKQRRTQIPSALEDKGLETCIAEAIGRMREALPAQDRDTCVTLGVQAAVNRTNHFAYVAISKVTAARLVSFVQLSYGAVTGVARIFHRAASSA